MTPLPRLKLGNFASLAKYAGILFSLAFLLLLPQVLGLIIDLASIVIGRSLDRDTWMKPLLAYSIPAGLAFGLLAILRFPSLSKPTTTLADSLALLFDWLNATAGLRKFQAAWVLALAAVLLATGWVNRFNDFNPDSWAYFELSKTVFGDDFYRFNTVRSYYSENYSTSFPFGYPVAVAIGHLVFGSTPITGVWINLLVGLSTFFLIFKISKQLRLFSLAGLTLASSTVLWTFYLDEVLSGRSIPLALALFLLAASLYLAGNFFWAGLLFGLSALVRFDYLVYGVLFQFCGAYLLRHKSRKILAISMPGFLLGLAPWVIYSYTHFNKFWVTDNSWIALSALPAYVADFPAMVAVSAFDSPLLWLRRVFGNILPLTKSVSKCVILNPAVTLLGAFVLSLMIRRRLREGGHILVIIFCLGVSVSPYLLTGYFDARYFSLAFLVLGFLFSYTAERSITVNERPKVYFSLLAFGLLASVVLAGMHASDKIVAGVSSYGSRDIFQERISLIEQCHRKRPDLTLVFPGETLGFAPRYGATAGLPTAFIPSNFERMTAKEKKDFFKHITPFAIIDHFEDLEKCQFLQ
jgi:hypothetical protein